MIILVIRIILVKFKLFLLVIRKKIEKTELFENSILQEFFYTFIIIEKDKFILNRN